MTRPALRHRLEYLALAGAAAAARVLGERPAGRLGEWLGRIGYRPIGIRRSIVEAHLRHAFPDRSDAWVRATAAAAYAHLGREAMALLRLASVDRQELVRRTRVSGLHQLREA
ncbi:MAG: hypothetical protein HY561_03545, partial [Gemmatimonadetes bacterium]|nr:hypothetical protein [Gemmatimonadota bacterium]